MPNTSLLGSVLRAGPPNDAAPDVRANSIARLTERARTGALTWTWPLIMCGIRLPILAGCFLLSLALASAAGHPQAAGFAEGLTRFDLPLVADAICLALLWRLMRREGSRVRDLFCWSHQRLLRDLVVGVGLFAVCYLVVGAIEAGVAIASINGSAAQQAQAMEGLLGGAAMNPLGMGWQIGVSALLVPISAAVTEELVYRGYGQARLTALTGRPWLAVAITALGFAAQHIAYGLTSWHAALAAVAGAGVAGLLFAALYLLTRQRLFALIVLHWQFDVISLGVAPILLAAFIR
ncbi:MAG TPA: CPBP family intramembrane glutamic endopeptidase [Ktedonobacterales bacterium]